MKTILFLAAVLLITVTCYSQEETKKKYDDPQNMDVTVDQEAHFPEGEQKLLDFINEKMVYPPETKGKAIEGSLMLSFDVMPDSTLANFAVIQGVGYGVDEEVILILKDVKYAPSIQNGVKLRMNVIATFPFRFRND